MVNSNGLRGKLRQASLKVLGLNQFLKIVINVELPMCQSSGCVHLLSVGERIRKVCGLSICGGFNLVGSECVACFTLVSLSALEAA